MREAERMSSVSHARDKGGDRGGEPAGGDGGAGEEAAADDGRRSGVVGAVDEERTNAGAGLRQGIAVVYDESEVAD